MTWDVKFFLGGFYGLRFLLLSLYVLIEVLFIKWAFDAVEFFEFDNSLINLRVITFTRSLIDSHVHKT